MPIIKSVRGFTPQIESDSYLAENSVIIGDVKIGKGSSVWFNAVIRGDVNSIRIGENVNIQDGAVLHCNYKDSTCTIGNNVSIGHNAIVHGADVGHGVLIGMGAIVMDHAKIGENSVIAAGAVITKHMNIEPGSVYAGIPAKKIKSFSPEQLGRMTMISAERYKMIARWYKEDNDSPETE